VILPRDLESVWFDSTLSRKHVLSMLEPYPAEAMAALEVSARVNSVRNDDPGLLGQEPLAA
jgi:putative SOS response-associated peptidase YedK